MFWMSAFRSFETTSKVYVPQSETTHLFKVFWQNVRTISVFWFFEADHYKASFTLFVNDDFVVML